MNEDRRNPYLVLGVPFGASRQEATAAFARRSRRARREDGFPYSIDDLTWALHQVEERMANPAADVDTFRVPADRDVVRPPQGPGALVIEPRPISRRTGPTTSETINLLHRLAVEEAIASALQSESKSVAAQFGLGNPSAPLSATIIEPAPVASKPVPGAGRTQAGPHGAPIAKPRLSVGAFALRVGVVVGLVVGLVVVGIALLMEMNRTNAVEEGGTSARANTVPNAQPADGGDAVVTVATTPRPATTMPPPTTRATTTLAPTTTVAGAAHPYFDLLTNWSLSGALQMQDESVFKSPAWAYARHLEQVHRVSGDGGLSVTFAESGGNSGELCIATSCFDIADIELSGSLVYSFTVNGVDIGPMSSAWADGDEPLTCWYDGSDQGCPASNAVTMALETIYTVGSTTWISVEFDVGSMTAPDLRPTSAWVGTSTGRVASASFSGSNDLYTGMTSVWLLKFTGITNPDISQVIVTLYWDGAPYDCTIDLR